MLDENDAFWVLIITCSMNTFIWPEIQFQPLTNWASKYDSHRNFIRLQISVNAWLIMRIKQTEMKANYNDFRGRSIFSEIIKLAAMYCRLFPDIYILASNTITAYFTIVSCSFYSKFPYFSCRKNPFLDARWNSCSLTNRYRGLWLLHFQAKAYAFW